MVDIWNGDIALSDGSVIRDVGLAASSPVNATVLGLASLRFLSTVDTARIPLYLAAGPSLDVWTSSEETEAWFEAILLSKTATIDDAQENEWWNLTRSQSPIGILVQVECKNTTLAQSAVTELLFYGTIAPGTAAGLPTPPTSSREHGDLRPELRVHALPLSSHLIYRHPDGLPHVDEPQFIATFSTAHHTPGSPKRLRDIFEEASIANKKARVRGGQGIAAAAAKGADSQQRYIYPRSFSAENKAASTTNSRPSSSSGILPRPSSRQHSLSPSSSSDLRPMSRKGVSAIESRRSNLSQVATIPLQPEEPTIESRNKEALSKVVMAAMRMHGLQQRKKSRSRRASVAAGVGPVAHVDEEIAVDELAKDDEYKLIYHQTYKGAALALRKHISEKPLHAQPDRMRDLVEKFLSIFLTDPLVEPIPSDNQVNPVATPGENRRSNIPGSSHSHASPFDLPSIRRPGMNRAVTDGHIYSGSPMGKKDHAGDLAIT